MAQPSLPHPVRRRCLKRLRGRRDFAAICLLAYRAAVEIPHKLAAFSVVLSCMPPPHAARPPTVALPALIFGCTADPLMPYRGGKFFYTLGSLDPVCSIEDSPLAYFCLSSTSITAATTAAGSPCATSASGMSPNGLRAARIWLALVSRLSSSEARARQ